MSKITISIERTGNTFSIASTEFLITFPDGTTETLWSPPWHEMDKELEDARALEHAAKLWADRCQIKEDAVKARKVMESTNDPH